MSKLDELDKSFEQQFRAFIEKHTDGIAAAVTIEVYFKDFARKYYEAGLEEGKYADHGVSYCQKCRKGNDCSVCCEMIANQLDQARLEERDALKKIINLKKKKVITGNWEDMNLNEIVFNISDRTYNLALSDLLSPLNNEK